MQETNLHVFNPKHCRETHCASAVRTILELEPSKLQGPLIESTVPARSDPSVVALRNLFVTEVLICVIVSVKTETAYDFGNLVIQT